MLEQLNGLLNTTAIEEGAEAVLEYADSFGPWGRAAAVGITFGVTAATTLLMMNKCRAGSASKELSKKGEITIPTPALNDEISPVDDTAGKSLAQHSGSSSLSLDSDSDSDSESDNGSDHANRSRSRSGSPKF